MIRVVAGSRLHFGLMCLPPTEWWPHATTRYFGGLGMMVNEPTIEVVVRPAPDWRFEGKHNDRAKSVAALLNIQPHQVSILRCADAHTGLGVGTQLSLAIATGLTGGSQSPVELARIVGRGRRSSIGIHGFGMGGFLVDPGKTRPNEIPDIASREQFPLSWSIVLVTPATKPNWSGEREQIAFSELGAKQLGGDSMDRLVTSTILPAIRANDLPTFGHSITEFNIHAGEMFRSVQGGRYAHPAIEYLIDQLLQRNFAGAGQSSWGPTVFAFTDDPERIEHFRKHVQKLPDVSMIVTRARNHAAELASIAP